MTPPVDLLKQAIHPCMMNRNTEECNVLLETIDESVESSQVKCLVEEPNNNTVVPSASTNMKQVFTNYFL